MNQTKLLIWLLLTAAALTVILTAPPPQSDMSQFLPEGADRGQRLLLDEVRRGPGGRLLLLELSGAAPERLAQASKALAAALGQSTHFGLAINGRGSLGPEALEPLFHYRYLLAPAAYDRATLRQALEARLAELSSPLGLPDKGRIPADPTAAFRNLLNGWRQAGGSGPAERHGVWFSADGSRALLMLYSRHPAFDLDQQQQAVAAVRTAFRALPDADQLTLRMSGPLVFAVEARRTIRSEAQLLSLAASLGVSLLLWLAFRSPRPMLLAALPLASGVLAGWAAVILGYGQIHGIALAFGITLIGVAVDYPIHLFAHAGGRGESRAAMAAIWPVMRLGLLTTALGFCALLLSDFGGLSQLGAFAVAGLIAAAAVTRFVLPDLTRHLHARSLLERPAAALFQRLPLPWLPPLVMALAAMVLVTKGDGLWERDLARLSPISDQARELDHALRRELGAPDAVRVLLLQGDSAETVLQLSEQLEPGLDQLQDQEALRGFDLPSRYLPSSRTQLARRAALPRPATLAADLRLALEGLPFKPGLFTPFLDDMEKARTLEPLTPGQLEGTPLGLRLAPLLNARGKTWVGVATLSGISNEAAVERLAESLGNQVTYLNLSRESARMVAGYRDAALRLSALGTLLIVLVLAVALRDARLTLRVVTPVAAAVLGSAAILALLGQQLSLFHIAALLLVLGIGIDYALFVAKTPADHPRFAATAGSLLLCNLSTLLVFGLLASSDLPVLFAIGSIVALGALLSFGFSAMMVREGV